MAEKQGEKQIKAEFAIITYPIKQMGTFIPTKTVLLFESFVKEHLGGTISDSSFSLHFSDKKRLTKVGCPFCKKGVLELIRVKPRYGGEPKSAS